ncbi:type VII secretion protein EccB [Nocardia donostiensis]|uniref:Type VII secretion protein EccB n=1 Tax=Nocardia donostiensis TaxID=1538463 RepID=A0A1W0B2E2_9NOCA|nr:type VII secretion protein EccB [Nocardia donostiensis]ONM46358.1 type VII secretion protein EccB [Nocardia donostiensis]OQS16679.1 type VII secretion protein EccB [Nocardia donostiensis]OQS18675.1 type VII secretion protein EccB [Nocardia donostiensis]
MARFRVVTKHQVSGWRFLLHRIEHALVRRDASMIDDPQRGRSTALAVGVALACIGIAGAAILAFFKPAKPVGNSRIVAEKDTGALYVRIGDRLHPALNLTSAHLITGSADKPVEVSRDELAKYPRGPWVGIPGAPGQIADDKKRDSSWAVCDTARTGASAPLHPQTGLPTLSRSALRTTAIGGPLTVDDDAIRELTGSEARLLRGNKTTWLVYLDPAQGLVRAEIDLADSPVMLALGIDATAPVVAASKGLIDAIPEAPPLRVPAVPDAGQTVTLKPALDVVIGSVLTVSNPDRGASYYLASRSGLVRISPVLAAMVRNADSHGSVATTTIGPDVLSANLRPGDWPGTATYPSQPVDILDPGTLGVTCYHWSRDDTDPKARTRLLVGRQLPLAREEQERTVGLVTAPASNGNTADAAYLPRTSGKFVQVTGAEPGSPLRESLYWISDSGVRYGIAVDTDGKGDLERVLRSLGLSRPIPAPWSIVSLFAVGPPLSKEDALILHDGIPPNMAGVGMGG